MPLRKPARLSAHQVGLACALVLEAPRSNIYQANFLSWWPRAVRHQCFALNVTDDSWSRARGSAGDKRKYAFVPEEFGEPPDMRGNLTAYERRHGQEYTGLDLPFGCAVRFRMPPPMLKSKHKFDVPTKDGAFLGWELAPGGVWHGDYVVADLDDLVSGKRHVRIYIVKELNDPDEIVFLYREYPTLKSRGPRSTSSLTLTMA